MAYITQYSNSVPVIRFNIEQVSMCIGRDIEMDICVPEDGVAARHACIQAEKQPGGYRFVLQALQDESVRVNHTTVTTAELHDGDWLNIGGVEFRFTDDGINHIVDGIDAPVATEAVTEHTAVKTTDKDEAEAAIVSSREFIEKARFSRRLNIF